MKYSPKYETELEVLMIKLARNKKLFREFLVDLLSPAELKELTLRLQIVKQLHHKVPQRFIAKKLKTSLATVTRGSRELLNKKGGFKKVMEKYYKKTSK